MSGSLQQTEQAVRRLGAAIERLEAAAATRVGTGDLLLAGELRGARDDYAWRIPPAWWPAGWMPPSRGSTICWRNEVAVVSLSVSGRVYDVACDDNQIEQVRGLARELDDRAQGLVGQLGAQPEGRLLVMVALMVADELAEARETLRRHGAELSAVAAGDGRLADGIGQIAERIEAIAERLERT